MTPYVCLVGGVVGLMLPFLPGVPLLALGIRLLDTDQRIRRRTLSWIDGFKQRFGFESKK